MSDLVTLPPGVVLAERPFTHPNHTLADLGALERAWETLRALHRSGALHRAGPDGDGASLLMREWCDDAGMIRRVVLNRLLDLERLADLTLVGFCGQQRSGADVLPIHEMDVELVNELHTRVDILCHFTSQLDSGEYVNLVLFRDEQAKELWAASRRHCQAARTLSPSHYRSVRIHSGYVPGGLHVGAIHLTCTHYYDYLDTPSAEGEGWRAVRYWQPPVTLEHGLARQEL